MWNLLKNPAEIDEDIKRQHERSEHLAALWAKMPFDLQPLYLQMSEFDSIEQMDTDQCRLLVMMASMVDEARSKGFQQSRKPRSEFSILGLMHKFGLAYEKAGGSRLELQWFAEHQEDMENLVCEMVNVVNLAMLKRDRQRKSKDSAGQQPAIGSFDLPVTGRKAPKARRKQDQKK